MPTKTTAGKIITYNPSVTVEDDLSKSFRIFTTTDRKSTDTANRPPTAPQPRPTQVVYTDGSCINNGAQNAAAGAGIWYGIDHPSNAAIRVPGRTQSNQLGELAAILHALQNTPPVIPLHIITDSKYCIDGIVRHSPQWEAKGWIGVANREWFQAIISWARARAATTSFEWVKGHSGNTGNEGADRLAAIGATKPPVGNILLHPQTRFLLSGAQIIAIDQKTLYRGIKELETTAERRATTHHIQLTKAAVLFHTGLVPTTGTIWNAIRNRNNRRLVQTFLWRLIHNAFRCGEWWQHISGFEERSLCGICQQLESVEHILIQCPSPGRKVIWSLVTAALFQKAQHLPRLSLGSIIGANLLEVPPQNGLKRPGATRLQTILITESAYLIWKIRCERVMERALTPDTWHNEHEIKQQWYNTINRRLQADIALTHPKIPTKQRLRAKEVLRTWSGIIAGENLLPEDWTTATGVLVGGLIPQLAGEERDEG
ncbi:ribonuclease H-like protein [Trametopsis cervina]|nr:ribonuclease H-like protein [Trametopsis cervina]